MHGTIDCARQLKIHRSIRASNGLGTQALQRPVHVMQRCHIKCNASSSDAEQAVKAVIFDVDGVLCSSEHLSRRCEAGITHGAWGTDGLDPSNRLPGGSSIKTDAATGYFDHVSTMCNKGSHTGHTPYHWLLQTPSMQPTNLLGACCIHPL